MEAKELSLADMIFESGIVGCGGAGFPTHVKMKSPIGTLIMNCAECEPLLRTDRMIVRNHAQELIEGLIRIKTKLPAENCVIALKSVYEEEVRILRELIALTNTPIRLQLLQSFYPAGDEHSVVYEVTGCAIPPGGIPLDVDAVVVNAATVLCIHDALSGIPFTHKYVTVNGDVEKPIVVKTPIGTPVKECIELAGGAKSLRCFVKNGGPIMGRVILSGEIDTEVITKTTSGLIVLPEYRYHKERSALPWEKIRKRAASACIQCRFCTDMCPRYLLGHPIEPHMIMRSLILGASPDALLENRSVQNAAYCCECGICTLYACPMGLQPSEVNKTIKSYLETAKRQGKKEDAVSVRAMRDIRKIPTKRIAARAGVLAYYDRKIESVVQANPCKVTLPLKQSVGAPSVPIVSTGDAVTVGQLIAVCPKDSLGANLHASISGIVVVEDRCIVICGQKR
jgi:Na+-translocating ferredoxin:NAD+ oxidoreductase RnfC subunit